MRYRSRKTIHHAIVGAMIIMSFGAMGLAYAMWTEPLEIGWKTNTGFFDLEFKEEQEYSIKMVDAQGKDVEIMGQEQDELLTGELSEEKKLLALEMEHPFVLQALLDGGIIQLEYPVAFTENTSVLEAEMAEVLEPILLDVNVDEEIPPTLIVDGVELAVSTDVNLEVGLPELQMEMVQELRELSGSLIVDVQLSLTEESIDALKLEYPLDIAVQSFDFAQNANNALVAVAYEVEVPFDFMQVNRS